jgi:hypothetical protein
MTDIVAAVGSSSSSAESTARPAKSQSATAGAVPPLAKFLASNGDYISHFTLSVILLLSCKSVILIKETLFQTRRRAIKLSRSSPTFFRRVRGRTTTTKTTTTARKLGRRRSGSLMGACLRRSWGSSGKACFIVSWCKNERDPLGPLFPLTFALFLFGNKLGVWMSDKPLVQQALTQSLANLVLDIRPAKSRPNNRVERTRAALSFWRAFWQTMAREWNGLDALRSVVFAFPLFSFTLSSYFVLMLYYLRMDKYYLLLRRFVRAGFRLLAREGWDPRAIDEFNTILNNLPLQSVLLTPFVFMCPSLADFYPPPRYQRRE